MTKGNAFLLAHISLLCLWAWSSLVGMLDALGGPIIAGIVGNVTVYLGGNVADNWQRSANYVPELDKGKP
jgi:hypothetical protein